MVGPLIVDIYAGDLHGKPDIAKLVAAGSPWHGLIIKATQGDYYSGGKWFQQYWPEARDLAGSRYGQDWFRGCYHYIDLDINPIKQAEFYLSTVDKAGGWDKGDFWPIVDVEGANNPPDATAKQIEDGVSAFAAKVEIETGRKPVLYGNIYLAEHGVKTHMGCQLLWIARYSQTLPSKIYQRIGWELKDLLGWQYAGDGEGFLAGYPLHSPIGDTDISTLTIAGGGDSALQWVRSHLFAEDPSP